MVATATRAPRGCSLLVDHPVTAVISATQYVSLSGLYCRLVSTWSVRDMGLLRQVREVHFGERAVLNLIYGP